VIERIGILISDCENNGIITNNVVNSSIGENRVNLSNYLSNECINIYVMWYQFILLPSWWKR